jgi:PTH2 family peptidyl-tRNA hydrolase
MPVADGEHLYQYAIIRGDLDMPPGKLSAQAGHCYGDSFANAEKLDPATATSYRDRTSGGSKVTLVAKNQTQLIKAFAKAREIGLPCALIVDQHHIMPPHFNGQPIITGLGIGPCTKDQCREITKKFRCL